MKRMSSLSLLLTLAMLLTLLSGCGSPAASDTTAPPAETSSLSAAEPEAPPAEAAPEASASEVEEVKTPVQSAISFPLDETETLTYWHDVDSQLLSYIDTGVIDDAPAFVAAEEATNVHISHTAVSMDAESDQFNLMVAGGDYTDLIKKATNLYSKGSIAAMDDDSLVQQLVHRGRPSPGHLGPGGCHL